MRRVEEHLVVTEVLCDAEGFDGCARHVTINDAQLRAGPGQLEQ